MPYGRRKSKTYSLRKSTSKILNYLAMFAGLVLSSVVLLMLIGKLFQPKAAPAAAEKTTTQNKIETETEISTSSALDLASRLTAMKTDDEAGAIPVIVDRFRQRIKIANQLLILESTESQKELAILSKIDALAGLLDLAARNQFTFPREQEEWNSICDKYQMDQNEKIRTRIQLVRFRLNGLAAARQVETKSKDPVSLVNEVKPLLQRELSEDQQMHLWKSFEIFSLTDKQFGQNLESAIFEDPSFEKLSAIARGLRDKTKIVQYDLVRNAMGVINDLPEAREKTFEVARMIAKDPLGGERIINELGSILDWIEQIQRMDVARETFQLLIDSAPERATPELTEKANQIGKNGLRRCELVGRTFEFGGIEVHGNDWNPGSWSNHWILIFFTTSEGSAFPNVVEQSGVKNLMDHGFKILVVNLPEGQAAPLAIAGEERYVKKQSFSRIMAQYPVRQLPQAILINPKGKVVRTAIPMRSLVSLALETKEEHSKQKENSKFEN